MLTFKKDYCLKFIFQEDNNRYIADTSDTLRIIKDKLKNRIIKFEDKDKNIIASISDEDQLKKVIKILFEIPYLRLIAGTYHSLKFNYQFVEANQETSTDFDFTNSVYPYIKPDPTFFDKYIASRVNTIKFGKDIYDSNQYDAKKDEIVASVLEKARVALLSKGDSESIAAFDKQFNVTSAAGQSAATTESASETSTSVMATVADAPALSLTSPAPGAVQVTTGSPVTADQASSIGTVEAGFFAAIARASAAATPPKTAAAVKQVKLDRNFDYYIVEKDINLSADNSIKAGTVLRINAFGKAGYSKGTPFYVVKETSEVKEEIRISDDDISSVKLLSFEDAEKHLRNQGYELIDSKKTACSTPLAR